MFCWHKKTLTLTVASVILVFFAGSKNAYAAGVSGDNEILVSGGFFHSQGSDTGNLNADLNYGYYLSPNWQIGFRQALNYNFIDDKRDFWNATTTPFVNFLFPLGKTVIPFIGGFMGLVWNDRDVTGTIGPSAGIKLFFLEQTFVNVAYRYEIFFNRIDTIDDNRSRGNHVFNLGVGFVWGGERKTTN